jgi:hypothetical protein
MSLPRKQRVSDALHLIADLIQEADSYLQENLLHGKFDAPKPKLKDGVEPHKRSAIERIERRVREKIAPLSRNVLRAKRERKARSRYQTLKNVKTPRKVLGSRLRTR